MNRKSFGKVLLLVALGVASSFVTSTLLALGRSKKPKVSSEWVSGPLQPANVASKVGPRQAALPPVNPSSGLTSVQSLTVQSAGDSFRVSGRASIRDVRPNVTYVWSIRVRDPVKKVFVDERRYDTQTFQVPQDTFEMSPTFDDTIKLSLPPGTYNVELVLYEVPRGGAALLDDPDVSRHQLMAKNTVRVRVGG